jgi:hypothetical protein
MVSHSTQLLWVLVTLSTENCLLSISKLGLSFIEALFSKQEHTCREKVREISIVKAAMLSLELKVRDVTSIE